MNEEGKTLLSLHKVLYKGERSGGEGTTEWEEGGVVEWAAVFGGGGNCTKKSFKEGKPRINYELQQISRVCSGKSSIKLCMSRYRKKRVGMGRKSMGERRGMRGIS